jgi:hypothetical protein
MAHEELQNLTDENLDFTSERWGWSQWSIRQNLSHMAFGPYNWFWGRWKDILFPGGLSNGRELDDLLSSANDRQLDTDKYWELNDLLVKLRESLNFGKTILESETVGSCKSKAIQIDSSSMWIGLIESGYSGITRDESNVGRLHVTLEATFRLRYFEHITHLYNIQRLKKAQDLATVVQIPMEGFLALPWWDLSQP